MRDVKGRKYVGITTRLRARISEHDAGRRPGDRGRGPFTLIYREAHADHQAARAREQFFKSGVGRKWLNNRLAGSDPLPGGGLNPPGDV